MSLQRTLGMVMLLAAAACTDQGPLTGIDDLARAEDAWRDFGANSYTYAIERQCFCGLDARGPVRVTVINGAVVAQVYVESGASVSGDAQSWFPDVDGLFDVLRAALNDGAHRIDVTYDAQSGVPVDFWIDYEENTADEELGFRVTESVEVTG